MKKWDGYLLNNKRIGKVDAKTIKTVAEKATIDENIVFARQNKHGGARESIWCARRQNGQLLIEVKETVDNWRRRLFDKDQRLQNT